MQNIEENPKRDSRAFILMLLICQTLGSSSVTILSSYALDVGITGTLLSYTLVYLFLGIPLLYMELTVSQFSTRDNIQIWKVHPCLSHFGYMIVIWQFFALVLNNFMLSLVIHYLLMSFESPIPFTNCGSWAKSDCNALEKNFTVYQYCVKKSQTRDFCKNVYRTFPAFQYKRYHLLILEDEIQMVWRMSLATSLACVLIFFSCFKRDQSIKWIIKFLTIYPSLGYSVILIGSMLQKGVVAKYDEAFDGDFKKYSQKFRLSIIILKVIYSTGLGSGLTFNLGLVCSFRSPCYSNSVISMVAAAAFTGLVLTTTAISTCPLLYHYNIPISLLLNDKFTMMFDVYPILFHEYDYPGFYLIILYSTIAVLMLRTSIVLFYGIQEAVSNRLRLVDLYPGLTTFVSVICMFVLNFVLLIFFVDDGAGILGQTMVLIPTLIVIMECIVFVLCYGINKFSEDLHFMQGIQPSIFMKLSWVASVPILAASYLFEFYWQYTHTDLNKKMQIVSWALWFLMSGSILIVLLIRLLIGAFYKKIKKLVQLDPTWGPQSELLLRSRAMFTAQAMTKEYMYRQYHLQAGILARQKLSNKRIELNEMPSNYSISL